jgi:hypothetical protein
MPPNLWPTHVDMAYWITYQSDYLLRVPKKPSIAYEASTALLKAFL